MAANNPFRAALEARQAPTDGNPFRRAIAERFPPQPSPEAPRAPVAASAAPRGYQPERPISVTPQRTAPVYAEQTAFERGMGTLDPGAHLSPEPGSPGTEPPREPREAGTGEQRYVPIPGLVGGGEKAQPLMPSGQEMGSAARTFGRSAADVPLSFPQQFAVGQERQQRAIASQWERIDRGEQPSMKELRETLGYHDMDLPAHITRPVVEYMRASPEQRQQMRAEVPALEERAGYRAAEAGREAVEEALPRDVRSEKARPFLHALASGFGSTAGFVGTGLVGSALGVPPVVTVGLTGMAANSAAQFRDAVQSGASFQEAAQASEMSGLLGLTEAAPIARAFDRFDKATGGTLKRAFTEAIKGGTEESVQEITQSVGDALIASDVVAYDPERKTFEGVGEAAGVGFTVGGLMNFVAAALGARVRQAPQEAASPEPMAAPAEEPGAQPEGARPERGQEILPPEPAPTPAQPERGDLVAQFEETLGGIAPEPETPLSVPPPPEPDEAPPANLPATQPNPFREALETRGEATGAFMEPVTAAVAEPAAEPPALPSPAPPAAEAAPARGEVPAEPVARPGAAEGPYTQKHHGKVPEIRRLPAEMLEGKNTVEMRGARRAAENSNLPLEEWAATIDLSEPIDVTAFADGSLQVQDGHHRLLAARTLGRPLNVNLSAVNARPERLNELVATFGGQQQAAPPAEPAQPSAARQQPQSLLAFIASRGGIKDEAGEMRARDLHRRMVPRHGRLVRKKGVSPDYVREAAVEAGYLPEDATVDDLFRAMEREARGDKVYPPTFQGDMDVQASAREAQAAEARARDDVSAYARELDETFSDAEVGEIVGIMSSEGVDAETAVDHFVERLALQTGDALAQETGNAEYADIPFEGGATAPEGRAGEEHQPEAAAAGAPSEPAAAEDRGVQAEEGAVAPETLATEQTPEGEQTVLPGAEQRPQREVLERRMAQRDVRGGQQGLEGSPLFDEGARPDRQGTMDFHAGLPFGKLWDWFLGPIFARHYEPLGTLPNRTAYLEPRYLAQGRADAMDRIAHDLYKRLDRYDEATKEQIYDYLTTADAAADMADPQARKDAVAAKKLIDMVGREMVHRGVLEEAQYRKYKDAYLPRIYLKFLFQSEGVTLGGGNRPRVSAEMTDRLKQRKDIPAWEREILLGEVKDPAFLASKAFGQAAHSIAIWDFYEEIARHPEWIYPQSLVDWRGKKVTNRWLLAEAERLRSMRHLYPEDMRDAVRDAADEMETAAREAMSDPPDPNLYQQVPDTKRWGHLRGLWVRKEIYDDFVNSTVSQYADSTIQRVVNLSRKGVGFWKGMKTAWSLSGQARNFVSGSIQAHMFGEVPFVMVPQRTVEALYSMATGGRYWQTAKKWGVKSTSFAQSELLQVHNEFKLKQSLKHYRNNPIRFLGELGSTLNERVGDLYSLNEQLWKTAVLIHHMKRGMPEGQAAIKAHEAIFDYSLVPNWLRWVRSSPTAIGVPFVTFAYKSLPKSIETALKRPWALMPYIGMVWGSMALLQQINDLDDEDAEKLWELLPEWLDHGLVAFLPVQDEHGRWQPVDISYTIPFGGWWSVLYALSKGNAWDAIQHIGVGGSPAFSIPAAVFKNEDGLGREIYREGDPPQKRILSVMTYIFNQLVPPWAGMGTGQIARLIHAIEGQPNRFGEPGLTPEQAAAKLGGVNIYPFDADEARNLKLYLMERNIRDAIDAARRTARDESLSDEARREALDEHERYIDRLNEEMKRFQRKTRNPPGPQTKRQSLETRRQAAAHIRSGDLDQLGKLVSEQDPEPEEMAKAAQEAGSPALATIIRNMPPPGSVATTSARG